MCREEEGGGGGWAEKRLPWSEWRQSGRMHVSAGFNAHALAKSGLGRC